jgi:hypothetical protein
LSQVALAAIQVHEVALCRPLLAKAPGVRAGALLWEARGVIAGATVAPVKRTRRGDGIMPLNANMRATQEARQRAEMADTGESQPSRAAPRLALGRSVAQRWAECEGPLNAGGMRLWNQQKKPTDPSVWVTTDRQLSAAWRGRPDAERPEIAPDDQPRKRGGWQRKKLSATRYSERVLYVLTVGLRYRL